jgi:hypothetical protein
MTGLNGASKGTTFDQRSQLILHSKPIRPPKAHIRAYQNDFDFEQLKILWRPDQQTEADAH